MTPYDEKCIAAMLEVRESLQKELLLATDGENIAEEAILAQYVQAVYLKQIGDSVSDLVVAVGADR
jgi:hypothetical protein